MYGVIIMNFFLIWSTPPSTFAPRHLRAVQSVVHHHPTSSVVCFSNTLPSHFFDPSTGVTVERYRLEDLVADSPLAAWYSRRGEFNRSSFFSNHEADLLRLLVLFRRGGVYVDTDVVFMRPLRLPQSCTRGAVGLESGAGGWRMPVLGGRDSDSSQEPATDPITGQPPVLCNAVMAFEAGHPLLARAISAFAYEYVPYTPGLTMMELFAKGEVSRPASARGRERTGWLRL